MEVKEKEKIDKCQDLAGEVRKLEKVKTKVVPIAVGALGTIPKGLMGVNLSVDHIRKNCLIRNSQNPPTGSTARRLQDVTCIVSGIVFQLNNMK